MKRQVLHFNIECTNLQLDKIMFQLQQLGLPLGFRSKAVWWQNYLISNYAKPYEPSKKSSR